MSFLQRWKTRVQGFEADTYALYLACKDPRTPWYAKLLVACVVGYAASPIDLIPDFVPVFGLLDDLIVVPLGAALAIKMVPGEVMAECREKGRLAIQAGSAKKTRWLAAAMVIAIWCLTLALLVRFVLGLVGC
ncbi:MAG: YkvA family protein [Dehalococcoidia bacterium]|nr:YkvA family protein [Dehalococcoidia bacterium]